MSDKPSLLRRKSKPSRPRAILFDLDGVLWESSAIHRRAFLKVLEEFGIFHLDYARVAGMKSAETLRTILRHNHRRITSDQLTVIVRKKQAFAHCLLAKDPPIRRHCTAVLKRLHKHFTLALVSSSSRRSVNLFLRASGTRRLFSVVLSGDDVTKAKPDPAIYRKALKLLRLKAAEALVVEDAAPGVLAARRLGIRTFAITGTTASTALREAGAEKIFANLMVLSRYADHL